MKSTLFAPRRKLRNSLEMPGTSLTLRLQDDMLELFDAVTKGPEGDVKQAWIPSGFGLVKKQPAGDARIG